MGFMADLVGIVSSRTKDAASAGKKAVEVTLESSSDNPVTSEAWGVAGLVSKPGKGVRGFRLRIGRHSIVVAAYNYGVEPPANQGETLAYSTDADGAVQATHLLTNDGNHVFNDGTDWAVRFSELETAFNQLRDDHDALVASYNAHVHPVPGVSTGGGSTTSSPTTSTETPSTADVSGAKVEEVQLP